MRRLIDEDEEELEDDESDVDEDMAESITNSMITADDGEEDPTLEGVASDVDGSFSPSPSNPQDRMSQILGLLSEENAPAMDAYRQHVSSVPQRFNESKKDRFMASLAGSLEALSSRSPSRGVALKNDILDRPYRRAVDDYTLKGKGLGTAAQIESVSSARNTQRKKAAADLTVKLGSEDRKREYGDKKQRMEAEKETNRKAAADRNFKSLDSYRKGKLKNESVRATRGRQTEEYIKPSEQKTAYELAAQDVLKEFPQFRKLFDKEGGLLEDADEIQLANFHRITEDRSKKRMSMKRKKPGLEVNLE